MKESIMLISMVLVTLVVFASEILPPDMRIMQLVREAHESGTPTDLWGVDYEKILQSDATMTKECIFSLLKSIDPARIKLAKHDPLSTVITMLEPRESVFTFEARESKNTKGPPTYYF